MLPVRLIVKLCAPGFLCWCLHRPLFMRCTNRMADAVRGTGLWLAPRLFFVDGSGFSMPDTPQLRACSGESSHRLPGPPVFRLPAGSPPMHFGSGLFQKVLTAAPVFCELSGMPQLHPELEADDILLGDRGFSSYGHLALLISRRFDGIFLRTSTTDRQFHAAASPLESDQRPTKQACQGLPRSRLIRSLGTLDQVVEWFRPGAVPPWLSSAAWLALPSTLLIRELRYTVAQPGFRTRTVTLVTTLLDPRRCPKEKLAEAYGLRWTIETAFGHLKTTMRMDVLHCRTVEGVLKELTMFLLVYNLVRMTVLEAARRQAVSPARISFADALRWLATAQPGDPLPELLLIPHRPGRFEPRRVRSPKIFPGLQLSRLLHRKLLIAQSLTD